jgi:dTDP-4-amino-4,6-dideoxygalactose transaminase
MATIRRSISDKFRPSYASDVNAMSAALLGGLSGTSDTVGVYERALAEWFGNKNAIAISSGAAAISVALAAVGVRPGDEVTITPTCPLCTVFPVMSAGATPVFVDTRVHGFGMDPIDLARVMNPRTKAIIDVPMWGYPTEVDELGAIARDARVPLILDLAHSHGSTLHGKSMAHYGDISCFSTHERKPLATGEGGFILTDSADLAERCRGYSRFGNLSGKELGLNYKLAALAAALGTARLPYLGDQIESRRQNAREIVESLTNPHVREKPQIPGAVANYYSLILDLEFKDNAKFIDYLEEHGVPSDIKRYRCRCLYEYPAVAQFARDCPNGRALLGAMTTLPVHPDITKAELSYMVSLINDYTES